LIYDDWEKFSQFLTYHGLTEFADQHKAYRFPSSRIKEHYFRHAKTFVRAINTEDKSSGVSSSDVDLLTRAHGQELEIVFVEDPFANNDSIEVQLLYQGEPLADRQVELFSRATSVTRLVTRTDAFGKARFDEMPVGEHMLNAVHMMAAQKRDVHWKTLWASVTFETVPTEP